ncbi:MAG: hypothetical protein GX138_08900 [Firmicutes bacterium]|jgi:predicted nucleotidyltransferase component of viral defense system|nr:hypothetical protein [Bacillota bacterium]
MKKYLLTSPKWEGEIEIVYNDLDLLISIDISRANLAEKQQIYFLRDLPRELYELEKLREKSPHLVITEVNQDVTFEMFWDTYDDKVRSSKKRALRAWNKLSKIDRHKAYRFIMRYKQSLYHGTNPKYAETYLNAELWNN